VLSHSSSTSPLFFWEETLFPFKSLLNCGNDCLLT